MVLTDWILVAFILLVSITVLLFLQYYRPAFAKKDNTRAATGVTPGISVILCVRNEYDNLVNLLPALLEQEYENFELVVVDKNSQDNTDVFLASLEHFNKNLTIRTLTADPKFGQDNLMALGIGIRAARYPYIVFFRPDCFPGSKNWLATLAKTSLKDQEATVLGYTSYKGSNMLIRYDLMEQQLHAMASATLKMNYTTDGNNKIFPADGFLTGAKLDMRTTGCNQCEQAIVSHVLKQTKATACVNPAGTVYMNRRVGMREYHMIRTLGLSTMQLTKARPYILLSLEKMLSASFYVMLFLTLFLFREIFDIYTFSFLGGMLLFRWITLWIHHIGFRIHLGEKGLALASPLWDMISPFVHFYFLIVLLIKNIKSS
ncbi:MAG TPA: glycosyltransferase [Bacteroidales bacterium]|nr:glycosyltransferase [Bacteroidales bacterium]HRW94425.1 glycosyltransferase [Bacteroidales bacterium]